MNWMSIQRIVGLLLMLFSASMLTPIIVGTVYSDATWQSFLFSFAITIIIGFIAWYPVRENKKELKLEVRFFVNKNQTPYGYQNHTKMSILGP